MAHVQKLFCSPKKHSPMVELQEARVLANFGLQGCAHAQRGGLRQILLVDRETLETLELRPGALFENVTTDGLNVNGLPVGQRLRIGEALLEVTMVCTPCNQMERIRPGLRRELRGRRGMMCRVLEGGILRPGDSIEKIQ
jgi:MOSC domain-containing protein YiiM